MLVRKLTTDYKYYQKSAAKAKKEIAVMSQYKAQVSALQTELKEEALETELTEEDKEQCTVCTVVASQG